MSIYSDSALCEQDARLGLAFALGTLAELHRELDVQQQPITALTSTLMVYPGKKELEIELNYLKLPDSLRHYFESSLGDQLFELIETLKANNLFRQ